MTRPLVSVVVPAHNAMPYITECVESVMNQTYGAENLELIVVDDGSNDGTGEELERLAAIHPQMRVVHQECSGGPSSPRNRGMDMATGKYLVFIDADDYFGHEAIERMVAMAEKNGSEIVLGKMTGIGGRNSPPRVFEETLDDADLFTSYIYNAVNPLKLFKKELLDRLGMRFPTTYHFGEDQPLVVSAYFAAKKISVVADYSCFYIRRRTDGQNLTSGPRSLDQTMPVLRDVIPIVVAHTEPGPGRDHLMTRHFRFEVVDALRSMAATEDPDVRQAAFDELKAIVDAYYNDSIAHAMPALHRVVYYLVQHGTLEDLRKAFAYQAAREPAQRISVDGKVRTSYPFLDDLSVEIPEWCLDATEAMWPVHRLDSADWEDGVLRLTGHVYCPGLSEETRVVVVLRERATSFEFSVEAPRRPTPELAETGEHAGTDSANAGFDVSIDPATFAAGHPLAPGAWDVLVRELRRQAVHEARLGSRRLESVSPTLSLSIDPARQTVALVTTRFAKGPGYMTLDVGDWKAGGSTDTFVTRARWERTTAPYTLALRVSHPAGKAPEFAVRLRTGDEGDPQILRSERVADKAAGTSALLVELPAAAIRSAVAGQELELGVTIDDGRTAVWFGCAEKVRSTLLRSGLSFARAKVAITVAGLTITATHVGLLGAIKRRLGRLF